MPTSNSGMLADERVSVRLKIAALWAAWLFLGAYGDIFGFYQASQIEEVLGGELSGIEVTQGFLIGASLYIAIPSVLLFLTLTLTPNIARWANIVLAILYVVSLAVVSIGEPAFFVLLSIIEGVLLLLIAWYAWTWPRQESTTTR